MNLQMIVLCIGAIALAILFNLLVEYVADWAENVMNNEDWQ